MPDHFMFQDEAHPEKEVPVLECLVTLGALAAATSRIRLGALVAGVPYRNPALLAKMWATLDVISHGRSIIGLGAAWHEPEFAAYGWPFPPVRQRMEMLEEAVQIVDRMLTQRPASFSGQHYAIKDAYNDPMPVQQPRPPIMIGGSGERVTLQARGPLCRLLQCVWRSGDGGPSVRGAARALRGRGRPFEQITRCNHVSILIARDEAELAAKKARHPDFGGIAGTPEVVVDQLREYAAAGSQYVTFHLADAEDIAAIRLLGEAVVPQVAALSIAPLDVGGRVRLSNGAAV